MSELPASVRAMGARGPEWLAWVDDLSGIVQSLLRQWDLRYDGAATPASSSLVLPVRTADGTAAVLKIGFPDADSEHEHLVLRRWGGDGAVRLLSADPRRHAMLLERLLPQNLNQMSDVEACQVVASIYQRIHVPAIPQLRTLTSSVATGIDLLEALPRSAPIPHRLVEQAIALSHELTTDPTNTGSILHGNLHYATVLASDREPWLTIAPTPLSGDPHYELAPMLWHRWDELTGRVRDRVRNRFYTLVDSAGFDEERARAWVVVRAVHEATRELGTGSKADAAGVTRYVAVAKAVQD